MTNEDDILHPTISVVVATYNGIAFLETQLLSIINQTVPPSEIVVVDDCSLDKTSQLCLEVLGDSEIPFQLYVNHENLGYTGSFSKAITLASGDLIFISDQDDYWVPNKLEKVLTYFLSNPCHVVIHNATVCDSNLRPTGEVRESLHSHHGTPFDKHIMGCCTMITREFRDYSFPIPTGYVGHDNWISTLSTLTGSRKSMPYSLVLYRRHSLNTSNPVRVSNKLSANSLKGFICSLLPFQQVQRSRDLNISQRSTRILLSWLFRDQSSSTSTLHLSENALTWLQVYSRYLDFRVSIRLSKRSLLRYDPNTIVLFARHLSWHKVLSSIIVDLLA